MSSGKIAALDVGERRIGVAMASVIARLPAPHTTIDRKIVTDVMSWLKDFVEAESIEALVVGLPRGLDGQETLQTKQIREFAAELSENVEVPVVMQDEAVTSAEAEERLKARKGSYSKADIDAEAASIILQDYLNQTEGTRA